MAVSETAIVTLEDAKTRLFESGSGNDSAIEAMIDHATALIEADLGRPVRKRRVTNQRIDGTGTPELLIPWTPVQSIDRIEIRDDYDDSGVQTITDSSKWILKDAETGLMRLTEDIFAEGRANILFTGDVGFAAVDVRFGTFKEAAYIAVDDYYRRWGNREIGVVNKSYPDGSASYVPAASLPPMVRQMIAPYRRAMGLVAS